MRAGGQLPAARNIWPNPASKEFGWSELATLRIGCAMEPNPAVLFVGLSGPIDQAVERLRIHQISAGAVKAGLPALASIQAHPPKVVVLNSDLPDLDAVALLKRLKRNQRTRTIPILFVADEPSAQDHAVRAGADDVLPSPWWERESIARLRNYVELAGLRAHGGNGSSSQSPAASKPSVSVDAGLLALV